MEPTNQGSGSSSNTPSFKEGKYRGKRNYRGWGNSKRPAWDDNANYQGDYTSTSDIPPKYSKKTNYPREYVDPFMAQAMMYRAEMYILTKYQPLIDINMKSQGIAKQIDDNSQFFVIKSFSEEDVHKAIKYGVWSSSKTGNQTLSNSFKLTQEKGGHVYLFYSCNGSGRYVGVAMMKSPCDEDKQFMYWTQDGKWPGLFDIEWIFIKDVPFRNFKNIFITMKDGQTKPVSNARDTQEVPFTQAQLLMEIIEGYQNTNTILEHFEYYDLRQENYDKHYTQS